MAGIECHLHPFKAASSAAAQQLRHQLVAAGASEGAEAHICRLPIPRGHQTHLQASPISLVACHQQHDALGHQLPQGLILQAPARLQIK